MRHAFNKYILHVHTHMHIHLHTHTHYTHTHTHTYTHTHTGLLDPRWIEEKKKTIEERRMQEEVLAEGTNIGTSLKHLAERRTDIFGTEETVIGMKVRTNQSVCTVYMCCDKCVCLCTLYVWEDTCTEF